MLTTSNVAGTECYVPLNKTEWTVKDTVVNGTNKYEKYQYHIDDRNYMYIEYLNGNFNKAIFYYMQDMAWKQTAYTMNNVNKTWDLATP